jgi:hypothetical protein
VSPRGDGGFRAADGTEFYKGDVENDGPVPTTLERLPRTGAFDSARSHAMQYMLLMQFPLSDWRTQRLELWPPEDVRRHLDFLSGFRARLRASGELVKTQGLIGPEEARIVRAQSGEGPGKRAVTDGPFLETKEFLAGYVLVEVASAERAYEIAADLSSGPGRGGEPLDMPIEVRRVHEIPG